MASLVLRNVKGSPLTNQEVDDNFNNLNTEVGLKLNSSQYTASNILTLLKTVDGIGSGLDADSVHGYVGDTENSPNSLVARDSNGDFAAETITATTLIGNVQGNVTGNLTGTVTGNATNVNGTVAIGNGGTGGTTQSSARDNLGLGSMAVQLSSNVNITGGSITGITPLAIAIGGTGGSTATQARSNLGLVIGGDIQPFSSVLTVLSNLSPNTDKLPYFSGTSSATTIDFTSVGKTLVSVTTASSARSLLGLTIGTDVQAFDADLSALSALSGVGLLVKTGAGTANTRSLTAGTGIAITNATGVDGNPTISVTSGAGIPTGLITLWYGATTNIPSGWALCNGSSGTPDLRDRFVVGAGTGYAVGATGGSKDSVVVAHSHSSSSTATSSATSNATSSVTDPSHNHSYTAGTGGQAISSTGTGATSYGSSAAVSGNKTTGITVATSVNTSVSTSVSTTVDSTGVSGTNANLPPYYALCYIMKL